MMFDEIVKTLRDYVLKDAMTKKVRLVISEAVDLIESQQEEIKRLKEHLTSVEQCDIMTLTDCDFCVNLREIMQENKRLRTELDETSDAETKLQLDNIRLASENKWIKAERDAAVEDLKRFSACCQCNANIDGSCCDMFDGTAENKYFCSNWQWRGPQAGKGETE